MRGKRFKQEQIIAILKEAEAGVGVADLCRKYGISDATFYNWKAKYGGLTINEARRVRQLEDENRRLKHIVAEQALEIQALKSCCLKKLLKPKAKRNAVKHVIERFGLSMRKACKMIGLSRTSFCYKPVVKPDEEAIIKRLKEAGRDKKAVWLSEIACDAQAGRIYD